MTPSGAAVTRTFPLATSVTSLPAMSVATIVAAVARAPMMIMVTIRATVFAAFAHYIMGRVVPVSAATSAMSFIPTVPSGNLERYSRIRLPNTHGKEDSRKNNELLHICLSLIAILFSSLGKWTHPPRKKFNRSQNSQFERLARFAYVNP